MIIIRSDVLPGDKLLRDGGFVAVVKVMFFDRVWGNGKRPFTDIMYRYPDGKIFSSDWPSDRLEAVRRRSITSPPHPLEFEKNLP